MKALTTTLILATMTFTMAFATSAPENMISTDEITVTELAVVESASFDNSTENLVFTTTEQISVIQIFDAEGTLKFQLPVMSNQVAINKNLFGEGNYKLGFLLKGDNQVHFSNVEIK